MHFNSPYIYYLETSDFDPTTFKLLPSSNPLTGETVFTGTTILMIQGNFCGYCTQFKPVFSSLASELSPAIDFATIQTDGKEGFNPDSINRIIRSEMRGVPTIVKLVQGEVVSIYEGPRTAQALKQWILMR
jgi:thioredoxin-like negative regulator of GroEL